MLIYWFLPMILFLGIVTSYGDFRFGKIRNKWISLALIYAFVVYSIIITHYYLKTTINTHFLIELSTNFLFATAIGFGAWYFGLWTAGDGKLFIAFSALIPLSVYKIGYLEWIPSMALLLNIFILSFFIMFGLMLFKLKLSTTKKFITEFLVEFLNPKQLISSILFLFAISWIVQAILLIIGLGNNFLLMMTFTMLASAGIQKKLGNKTNSILILAAVLRFILDKNIYSFKFLVGFLIMLFIWKFIRSFLTGAISKITIEIFTRNVSINKLKPGMVLAEIIQKKEKISKQELKKYEEMHNAEIFNNKGINYIKKPKSFVDIDNFIDEESEGLTKEQINKIKKIGFKKIKVSQMIPFAPFIFFGVILTIIVKGNILIYIKNSIL
tara:strand:+ start:6180 stop:7328 length:1149 start_codon:yes stop_codon:yes gene_type:complete